VTGAGTGRSNATGPGDPEQIKAEIEATRAQLAQTVDELGARLDVPARTREKAARVKDTVVETYLESPPLAIGGALAVVVLVLGLVLVRHRTTRRRKR
jgi:ElaB/YqjD/DUF883 family membrane-anchored ribosome-binding protein